MSLIVLKSGYVFEKQGVYPRIKGLSRSSQYSRWRIQPSQEYDYPGQYVYDNHHGGPYGAYVEAVRIIKKYGKLRKPKHIAILKEARHKKVKLGIPGVSVSKRRVVGGYSIALVVNHRHEKKTTRVPVGYGSDYFENWKPALEEAARIRNDTLAIYEKVFMLSKEDIDLLLSSL